MIGARSLPSAKTTFLVRPLAVGSLILTDRQQAARWFSSAMVAAMAATQRERSARKLCVDGS